MNAVYTKDDESETLGNKLADIDNQIDNNTNKLGVLNTQLSESVKVTGDNVSKVNQNVNNTNKFILNNLDLTSIKNSIKNLKAMSNDLINAGTDFVDNTTWASTSVNDITVSKDVNNIVTITDITGGVSGKRIIVGLTSAIVSGKKYRITITAKTTDITKTKQIYFRDSSDISHGITNPFFLTTDYTTNSYDIIATASGTFSLAMNSNYFSQNEVMTIKSITLKEIVVDTDNLNSSLVANGYQTGNFTLSSNGTSTYFQIKCINNNTLELVKKVDGNGYLTLIGLKDGITAGKYKLKITAKSSINGGINKYFLVQSIGNTTLGVSDPFVLTNGFIDYELNINITATGSVNLAISSTFFETGEVMTISNISLEEVVTPVLENTMNFNMPRPVIWDTDWWTDIDDVMAARILLQAEKARMIDIVCVIMDACQDNSVPSLDAFFTGEGRPNMTIGIDHNATDFTGSPSYQANMLLKPHTYQSSAEAEDGVTMYRRALASTTQKIDIICVGYSQVLANLLKSQADGISPLTGMQLVAQKVNKIWMMAGKYPSGSENNFTRNARSRTAGAYLCAICPVPITFCGWEVGNSVIAGTNLTSYVSSENDMLSKALYDFNVAHNFPITTGRNAWDPMTTLMACIGDIGVAGYRGIKGTNTVDSSTGANTFVIDANGLHEYVIKEYSDDWYVNQIDSILYPANVIGSKQLSK
jgi:hypothetical protein